MESCGAEVTQEVNEVASIPFSLPNVITREMELE